MLLAKNENQTFSPASLAKLMTMDLVFDALSKRSDHARYAISVSEYAWRTGGAPSRTATMFAALKSNVRVEDLIKGVAIQGANDSCIILAEGMSGSEAGLCRGHDAARQDARHGAVDLRQFDRAA